MNLNHKFILAEREACTIEKEKIFLKRTFPNQIRKFSLFSISIISNFLPGLFRQRISIICRVKNLNILNVHFVPLDFLQLHSRV